MENRRELIQKLDKFKLASGRSLNWDSMSDEQLKKFTDGLDNVFIDVFSNDDEDDIDDI
ncbi:hypothetical protein MOD96_02190 [Bacillus sp. S17B2]|uniref:hypothetical protein n=1 Tax=Bacillus sp. S17B2 TaxID=2918907 RepID=UPI0022812206|nr:hypothetical protein [Bacillus sp. S17B2]